MGVGIGRRGVLALVVIAVACSAPEKQDSPAERTGKTSSALVTARYEAEHMTWSGTEGVDGETRTAPPPTHRYLWTDGYLAQNHTFVGGSTTITVRAMGELLAGVGPHIVVTVGGTQVGSAYVNETAYASKTFTFNASGGAQEIRVTFDNDDGDGTEDRNLLVDWVEVDEPAQAPSCSDITYEAESMPWSGTEGVDGEVSTYPPPTHRYLWTDGYIYTNHAFAAGPTRIRVRAMGELLGGIGPHMVVSVGGTTIGAAYVDASDYIDTTFEFSATEGTQEVRVTYDNDDWNDPGDTGNDRNLLIDRVEVLCGGSADGGTSDGGTSSDGGSSTGDGGGGDAGGCIPASCTTSAPCSVAECTANGCVTSPAPDGTVCGGTTCTGIAVCQDGVCAPGAAPDCSSSDPCLVGTCDPALGCHLAPAPAGTSCGTPTDACSGTPTCDGAGTCQPGAPPTCASSSPCLTAACDPAAGCVLTPVAEGTPCDTDMNACNGISTCSATGECQAGPPPSCTSSDPCFVGACEPTLGCTLTPAPSGTPGCAPVLDPPPLDPTASVRMADSVAFLYSGSNPTQTGVAAGTISPERVGVVRGRVLDTDGVTPKSGVTVTIVGHAELGQTITRADGRYDLAVNGGTSYAVDISAAAYLPVQRRVSVEWHGWAVVDDVVLTQAQSSPDLFVTGSAAAQVVRGLVTPAGEDGDDARQAVLVFPPNTHLTNYAVPDGTPLEVQVTEYTRGPQGPQRMPGDLPPTVGYTYAFELGVPAAAAAGVTDVHFDRDVAVYIDNFTHFPVGETVPLGYYDRAKGAWMAEKSGRILKILSTGGGVATVDLDGDGLPDSGTALTDLGITASELEALASQYQAGAELWRVTMRHFSPWDCNWPFGPPPHSLPPPPPAPENDDVRDPCEEEGSIIGCESRTLGETIPIVGTPFRLHYQSSRTPGFKRRLRFQIAGGEVPVAPLRVHIRIELLGRSFVFDKPSVVPNEVFTWSWDGLDSYGRQFIGEADVRVRVGYEFVGVARSSPSFGDMPGSYITGNFEARTITLWREASTILGRVDARSLGFGGWTVNVNHLLTESGVLHKGDGRRRDRASVHEYVVETIAGVPGPGPVADNVFAKHAVIGAISDVAEAPDGTVYFAAGADSGVRQIRRIGTDGIVTTIAGLPPLDHLGLVDGGPALHAAIRATTFALGPDGSIFFVNPPQFVEQGARVWRIRPGPAPTLELVAGNGVGGYPSYPYAFCPPPLVNCGDGGDARNAIIGWLSDLAVASDGAIFLAGDHRIARIGPDGRISTYWSNTTGDLQESPEYLSLRPDGVLFVKLTGSKLLRIEPTGTSEFVTRPGTSGNPIPVNVATDWCGSTFGAVQVAALADESMMIQCGHKVLLRSPSGNLVHIAGGKQSQRGYAGDGGAAIRALFDNNAGLTVQTPRGFLVADGRDSLLGVYANARSRIRRVYAYEPLWEAASGLRRVPSEDGTAAYEFGVSGKQVRTIAGVTGAPLLAFGYDTLTGVLTSIVDRATNVTTISRSSNTIAITAPHGQTTTLSLDPSGYLSAVTNPNGEVVQVVHRSDGLLTALADARGSVHHFEYDEYGRLSKDIDATPGSGGTTLATSASAGGWTVALNTPEGRSTRYSVDSRSDFGDPAITERRTVTRGEGPDQLTSVVDTFVDGATSSRAPDGTKVTVLSTASDPRWGPLAPFATATRTDVGFPSVSHSMTQTEARTATPQDSSVSELTAMTITRTLSGAGLPDTTTTRVFAAGPPATWTTTSAAGRQTRETLDVLERVTGVAVLGTDPVALHPVEYHYDSRGRIDRVMHGARVYTTHYDPASGWVESTSDPADLGLSYTSRDGNGRPTQINLPGGRSLAMSYDPNGNVVSVTPPNKPSHGFVWDANSRLGGYLPPDLGFTPKDTTYTRDHDGLLLNMAQPATPVTFAYDALGRTSQIVDAVTKTFTYDPQGRLSSIATSDGVTLTNTYDGSLLAQQAVTGPFSHALNKTYDNFFRPSSWNIDGAGAVSLAYDGDGLITTAGGMTVSRGNTGLLKSTTVGAITDAFSYNGYGELVGHTVTGSATSYAMALTRDGAGRIETKTETIGATSHSERYTYDAAGRLWQVFVDGASTPWREWTYDANGNRADGTYDAQDRQLTHEGFSFEYGPNGELAKKTDDVTLAETLYAYDAHGSLRSVTLPAPLASIEYVIDGQNRRIGKKVGGSLVQGFLYDGARIVAELDASGAVVSRFVYATSGHSPDLMITGAGTFRLVKDHLGSPRLVANASTGAVAQRLDYDEWGNVTTDTSPGFQPFGFAGGLWDRDTNLIRFGARDYDPTTGRWTSKDRSRFRGGLNLYGYANNDPINFIDPTGHLAVTPGVGIGIGIGLGAAGPWGGLVLAGGAIIGYAVWDIMHQIDDFQHPTVVGPDHGPGPGGGPGPGPAPTPGPGGPPGGNGGRCFSDCLNQGDNKQPDGGVSDAGSCPGGPYRQPSTPWSEDIKRCGGLSERAKVICCMMVCGNGRY